MTRSRIEYGKTIFFGVLTLATIALLVIAGAPNKGYFAIPAVFIVLTGYFWWKADHIASSEED